MPAFALRVDGNRHIGLGHVFRNLYLADHLAGASARAGFLMLESSMAGPVTKFLGQRGLDPVAVSRADNPWRVDLQRLEQAFTGGGYDGVVMDLLAPDPGDDDLLDNAEYAPALLAEELAVARGAGLPVCLFSDRFDRMDFEAEVLVNTCPAQRREWYPEEGATRYLLGPQAYILAPSMARYAQRAKTFAHQVPRVVVFCGGNDHRGFTPFLLDGIEASGVEAKVEVILGAATPDGEAKARALSQRVSRVHFGLPDLAAVLASADFVFSASGNTLFDLAALGVPSAAVSTRERQLVTARFFESEGCCVDLGMDPGEIREAAAALCREVLPARGRLEEMSARGRAVVDGLGALRIVDALLAMTGCEPVWARADHDR